MLILLVALVSSGAPELNTEGFRLYQQGKYVEALDTFREAVAADEKHALAHYNLAATLGRLRTLGHTCDLQASRSDVIHHLRAAIALDERRRARMLKDADFDSVRDSLGYQRLVNRDPANEKDVRALLVALTFESQRGLWGPPVRLDLNADGTLKLTQLVLSEDLDPTWQTTSGTWKVKGRTVTLTLTKNISGVTTASGTFNEGGGLTFETPMWSLSSDGAECEA